MVKVNLIAVFIFVIPFIHNGVSAKSPVIHNCMCPKAKCPVNEEPGCRDPCPPETCITLYVAIDCVANQTCVEGCFCKPGYLRTTTNGTCVLPDQCLPLECINDPNAKKGCGNRCGKTCDDYKDKSKVCALGPCKKDVCLCKNGFVYDKNVDRCVKPAECTKQCTKPHERYTSCYLGECVPKTCEDLGKPLACPSIAEPCAGGCICEEGYVRDSKGNCVNAKTCPSCGGDPNAVSGCGNPCGKTCDSFNKTDLVCPQYCETNGCDCKKGYLLNTVTKKCTPIKDCPKPPRVCPKNEQLGCRNPCPPETCITLYAAFRCIANQTCVEGCFCKPGYLRTTTNGTCVPRDQCLPLECVNDPNAKKGCGNRCGKTCDDYKDKSKVCALGPCKKDVCLCKNGFVYDKNVDRCVKPAECTKQCTKPHERYTNCYHGECVPKTCEDLGKLLACPPIEEPCAGGCICEEGYVRDSKGNCVDAKTCPKQCTKPHESYINCYHGACVPKTCEDLGKPFACPPIAHPCAGGCICEEGYVRDSKGNCVDAKTCPSCGGDPNAVSGCGNPCGKTCDSFNNTDLVCPQYCETNGCDCKKGYLLNTVTKKCTPIKDCPKPPRVCPKNEDLGCRNPCPPETCFTLYAAIRCIDNQTCVDGCFCKPGYLRTTTNGTCVPRDQCLPVECVNDPNAKKGCGNRCGKTCDDYKDKSKVCASGPCKKDGCECKDGFIYDKNVNRCVKPADCTVTCNKPNERYTDCYAGQCSPKTCDDLGRSIPCPFIGGSCPGGCICNEGYLRDSNGTCIKQEKCPPKPCGANQTWVTTCNGLCPDSFCPRDDKPLPPCEPLLPCYPGCQCKLNYKLNATRNCILAPECPPVKCTRQNEVWDSCPSACLAENCEDVNHQPTTCNTLVWLCSPRCVCAKGHFRNKDGLCIPAAKCPATCNKPNEEYTDYPAGQAPTSSN